MKVRLKSSGDFIDSNLVIIMISDNKYRLIETKDGRLKITKISFDGEDDYNQVHPTNMSEKRVSW